MICFQCNNSIALETYVHFLFNQAPIDDYLGFPNLSLLNVLFNI